MEKLRELRNSKSLTQKYMAEFLKVDRTTYVKYETGNSEPNFDTLQKLATFFDVSVDYLLGNSNIKKKSSQKGEDFSDDAIKLATLFDGMSKDTQQKLLELADLYLGVPGNSKDR